MAHHHEPVQASASTWRASVRSTSRWSYSPVSHPQSQDAACRLRVGPV